MLLLLSAALLLLVALGIERVRLDRSRAAVPLRIAVTGTRGKTGVARMLASVLREDGRTVLAKTTGSEPCLLLPDGSAERIRRRGPASILEQKALLHRAARLRADALVAEIMSIHAENHEVEGRRLLIPNVVLATNFHPDHVEAAGRTREDVAALLARVVPPGARVLVPESERSTAFRAAVVRAGGELIEVPPGTAAESSRDPFGENADLVVAAARSLGVGDGAIRAGIARTSHDMGALGLWRMRRTPGAPPVAAVGAFAANDPESTMRVWSHVARVLDLETEEAARRCVGLLSLRADRGDRSLQWADALAAGLLGRFAHLLVVGRHAAALVRRVQRRRPSTADGASPPLTVLRRATPEHVSEAALAAAEAREGFVFGFGNIGGLGEELVALWAREGEAMGDGP